MLCSAKCPEQWRGDGNCDAACDESSCEYDDGDCAEEIDEQQRLIIILVIVGVFGFIIGFIFLAYFVIRCKRGASVAPYMSSVDNDVNAMQTMQLNLRALYEARLPVMTLEKGCEELDTCVVCLEE